MIENARQLEIDALALEPREKARLVEALLSSLDPPGQSEIDATWAAEAEDRLAALHRGDAEMVDAAVVFEEIEKRYSV